MSLKGQPNGSINTQTMESQKPSRLGNLAPELKLAIFSKLLSFDDYRRMAVTNKGIRALLQGNQVAVLRGIIVSIAEVV